jgi:uncharacterized membrane protein YhfC
VIPFSIVLSFVTAAIFTVVLPIALLIFLGIKRKIKGLPLLFGMAAFFVSQVVLRMPLMGVLSEQSWHLNLAAQLIPYALFLSFSAGLFEESARLGSALLLRKHRSYKDVISFGLGHAFCEVILLAGIASASNALMCLLNNSGGGLPIEQTGKMLTWLMNTNVLDVYLGVLERFIAVVFHIFATVLVFKGVVEKKIRYYFLAMLIHTAFNFSAVLLAQYFGGLAAEIVLLVLALPMGIYALKCKDDFVNPRSASI